MRQQKEIKSLDAFLQSETEYPEDSTVFPGPNSGHDCILRKLSDVVRENFGAGREVSHVKYDDNDGGAGIRGFYVELSHSFDRMRCENRDNPKWASGIRATFTTTVWLERGGSVTDFLNTIKSRLADLEQADTLLSRAYIRENLTACEDI